MVGRAGEACLIFLFCDKTRCMKPDICTLGAPSFFGLVTRSEVSEFLPRSRRQSSTEFGTTV